MSLVTAISGSWALLFGIALIMTGNGLQGSLLGLRATAEGFSTTVTGFVMAGYYLGFLIGSITVPRMLRRVGHIRVFAALASLASAAVLLHFVFVVPWFWGTFRVLTGIAFAGLYVVAESWLNDQASNENRGQLLAVYMLISFAGLGVGQLLLNVADPLRADLFILISVMVSLALIPISLTASRAPRFDEPEHVRFIELYRVSPLGIVGSLAVGLTHGALFGMGAVYASTSGFFIAQVSYFMGVVLLGGVLVQWPLGRLSDAFDRRKVITGVTLLAAASAAGVVAVEGLSTSLVFVFAFCYGGLCLPLQSLCVAYTNDHLQPPQMVAASATLILVQGVGAIAGPIFVAAVMARTGSAGFFGCLAAVHVALGIFALYRMYRRAAVPVSEQRRYPPVAPRISPVAPSLAMREVRDQLDRDYARFGGGRF